MSPSIFLVSITPFKWIWRNKYFHVYKPCSALGTFLEIKCCTPPYLFHALTRHCFLSYPDNFKSLETTKTEKTEKTKAEQEEFEQQRKATIAEALQAKVEGQTKKFGGSSKVNHYYFVNSLKTFFGKN